MRCGRQRKSQGRIVPRCGAMAIRRFGFASHARAIGGQARVQRWQCTLCRGTFLDAPKFGEAIKTQAISRYFADRGIRPQSLCVGHLHRYVPWTPVQGVWQSEMPAMCLRMSYMNAARAYGGALHAGYGVLVTKKGAFVPNESYVHFSASL